MPLPPRQMTALQPVPSTAPSSSDPNRASLFYRYQDGYRVAGAMNAAGQVVKWIGGGLAGFIAFGLLIQMTTTRGDSGSITFAGVLFAAMVGSFFYVIGMALASLGQIQKATLDSAVYSSTFLTNDDRAQIMSLLAKGQATSA